MIMKWLFAGKTVLVTCLVALMAGYLPAQDAGIEEAFRQGLYIEEVEGDAEAALKVYAELNARVDRLQDLGAKALFRQAECLRKLERTADAIAAYEAVLARYPANETLARLSRENLAALGKPLEKTSAAVSSIPLAEAEAIAQLRLLVENSPDLVNGAAGEAGPWLHTAAEKGQLHVVRFLLDHGARIDSLGPRSLTALQVAARAGHRAMCELLLDRGAENNGLSQALIAERGAVARLLIERGADPSKARFRWAYQDRSPRGEIPYLRASAVHVASGKATSVALLKAVLEANPDVDAVMVRDDEQTTHRPLSIAIGDRALEKVRLLMEAGADVKATIKRDGRDRTLFEWALSIAALDPGGDADDPIVDLLLENGVQWTDGNPEGVLTSIGGHSKWLRRALDAGLALDPASGGTRALPLHVAATRNPECLRLLIDRGGGVDLLDREGRTALHVAVLAETSFVAKVVEMLLAAGADPNAVDPEGGTPLSLCLRGWNSALVPVARRLLEHGANPVAGSGINWHWPVFRMNQRVPPPEAIFKLFEDVWASARLEHQEDRDGAVWLSQSVSKARVEGGVPVFATILSREGLDEPGTLRQFLKLVRFRDHGNGLMVFDPTGIVIHRRTPDGVEDRIAIDLVELTTEDPVSDVELRYGDVVEVPVGGKGMNDRVAAWISNPASMQVKVQIGEDQFFDNTEGSGGPVFQIADRDTIGFSDLIRMIGCSEYFIGSHEIDRPNDLNVMQTFLRPHEQLRHGDVCRIQVVSPEEQLSEEALRSGVHICPTLEGPFWKAQSLKMWAPIYKGSRGAGLELGMLSPHGLPVHPIDWQRAVVRRWQDGQWVEQRWLDMDTLIEPLQGIVLILPTSEVNRLEPNGVLRKRVSEHMSFDWKLWINRLPAVNARYEPAFFVAEKDVSGKWIWSDAQRPARRPVFPTVSSLFRSHPAAREWQRPGMAVESKKMKEVGLHYEIKEEPGSLIQRVVMPPRSKRRTILPPQ